MPLPKLSSLLQTHTVTLADDLQVMFQIFPVPGAQYQQIIDDHRDKETGKTPWENVAVPLMTVGIERVYSSVESTPVEFGESDAEEIWTTWPEWARWDVLQAVISCSTKGPAANPSNGSKPNANDGK